MKLMVAWLGCLVFLGWSTLAWSASPERPSASMVVTGVLDINPDGSVRGYTVDQPAKLPSVVLDVLKQTVPGWRFQVDIARPAIARARMSVRVVATPVGKTGFSIRVEGVDFNDDGTPAAETINPRDTPNPAYPQEAIKARTAVTVYVLLRVGRDGKVAEAGAEQVNFTLACPPDEREGLTKVFVRATLMTLRRWTFDVPTKGPYVHAAYWDVRVPVIFSLLEAGGRVEPTKYGSWEAYLPGPRRPLAWVTDQTMLASAPDATPEGGPTMLNGKPRLAVPH